MGPSLPLLAVLALAASRCRADSECPDGGAEPQTHGAESDDDGALAQLRTARVRPSLKDDSTTADPFSLTFAPPAASPGAGGSGCTPAGLMGSCFNGDAVCCGNFTGGTGSCQCCPGGCPGSQSTDSGDTPAPTTDDIPLPGSSTSPVAGGSECPIFDDPTGAGPAEMKKAGKCGADDCTCSGGGMIDQAGCRTCSAMLAQLRTARVRPSLKDDSTTADPFSLTFAPPAASPGAGGSGCTPAGLMGSCFNGDAVCCGNFTGGTGSCQCCPGGCPGSQSTDSGDTPAPATDDIPLPGSSTSPVAGGSECPIFDDPTGAGPAEMKKAGKCGADDCTCSGGGMIDQAGCRTCSAMR